MYLTRFRFNTARVGARRLLSSPQRLHAAVMSAFAEPPPAPSGGPRVLWRVGRNRRAETYLFIVSPAKPDLTHLGAQAGCPETRRRGADHYAPFPPPVARGARSAVRPPRH